MKLINQLRERMTRIGGKLDEYDDFFCLDAPSGYVWACNGNTSVSIRFANSGQTWLADAIKTEMPNLNMGLELVTDPIRIEQIRYDLDDDTWGAKSDAPATIAF